MNYTDIIRDLLDQQNPFPEETTTIAISNIILRILPLSAKPYFMRYENLQNLILSKCDLRNLQNFPKLPSLKQLDLSNNSLQGTLNYLMPLSKLNYLNVANNLINDFRKLQPLQIIEGLQIYVSGNPFVVGETWKSKVRNYGLKVTKQPRTIQIQSKKVKQEDKKQEKKDTNKQLELPSKQIKKELINPPENNIFLELRSRRQSRIIQHQERERKLLQQRRSLMQFQSESMQMFGVLGQHQFQNMIDHQEDEQSEELNDSENQESDKEKVQDDNQGQEAFLNNDLLDVFDADEDMQQDQEPSESPSDD